MKYLWWGTLMACVFATTLASAEDDKELRLNWNECRLNDRNTSPEREIEEIPALARQFEIEIRQIHARQIEAKRIEARQKDISDDGDGILQDYKKAAQAWFQKTVAQGRTWVEARWAWFPALLGEMYYKGTLLPQNYDKATSLIHKAAVQGSASAQARLGEIYYIGIVLPPSYIKATRWLHKAAKRGNPSAQNRLGEMYYNGKCVFKDPAKAAELFQKAAEQENISAQARLGSMYYDGHGVEQDDIKAFKWLETAAWQGNASAQDGLGVMYRDGKGVPRNVIRAYAWFNVSATRGNNSAIKHRSAIQEGMTHSEKAEGQHFTNEFLEQIPKDN